MIINDVYLVLEAEGVGPNLDIQAIINDVYLILEAEGVGPTAGLVGDVINPAAVSTTEEPPRA